MLKYVFLLSFSLFGLSSLAQKDGSEPDSLIQVMLDDIVVTATGAERQLSSLPVSSLIVKKEELTRANSVRLTDILNEQTGLVTTSDFGGGQGIQLQGLDSEHTLIMINGAPMVGRLAGTFDLNRLTVGNIKQVEVVKGASSSLYGSEALAGVINIITEKPKEGFNGNTSLRYGSLNSHDGNVSVDYKKDKVGIGAFFNRYSSNGYDLIKTDEYKTVDPYSNITLGTEFNYDFNEATSVRLSGRYFNQKQDIPVPNQVTEQSKENDWNFTAEVDHNFSEKLKTAFTTYYTNYRTKQGGFQHIINPFASNYFNQKLFIPEVKTTYQVNDNDVLVAGLGWRHESLDRASLSEKPVFNSQFVYAQYDGFYFDKLNIIGGLRFDAHSEYKSKFSPKLAARYDVSNAFAVKASLGSGFKAPDFRQLYFDFSNSTYGYSILGSSVAGSRLEELTSANQIARVMVDPADLNAKLKPESSVNINAGVQLIPDEKVLVEANVFHNNIKNLIDNNVVAFKTNGEMLFSYYNAHKVFTRGFDINTGWQATDELNIKTGYQCLTAKDKKLAEAHNDYFGLYNRSRHMTHLKLFYDITNWDAGTNLRATHRSKFGLTDTNDNDYLDGNDTFVKGYVMLDWAFNKTFKDNYTVSIGIDNLLDYTDAENLSNIPGRLAYATFRVKFQ